jgi:arylsulfatase A-like enzyme
MDSQIGRVLDNLKETGLVKNTIVVFTSDHGYHMGEHGHWQKQTLFNDATRVPLIFAGPNIKKNNKPIEDPVELVDLYPTIMDMLQMQTPKFVSGKSLVSYMKNSNKPVRESSLTELQVIRNNIKAQGYSIKTKRYRLTQWQYSGNLSYELYDHKFDNQELNNLANHADYIKIKDSLSIVLKQRVLEANKVPINLGKQIDNAKPWFEPKRILPKSKSK